jgi:hypothetical protein
MRIYGSALERLFKRALYNGGGRGNRPHPKQSAVFVSKEMGYPAFWQQFINPLFLVLLYLNTGFILNYPNNQSGVNINRGYWFEL